MTQSSYPTVIDGRLNYNPDEDIYWHGVLGWIPDYVSKLRELDDPVGVNKGELYRYLYHTGELGMEVYVYFKKVQSSPTTAREKE